MKTAILRKDGSTVIERIQVAEGLWERGVGLLGRKSLAPGNAMMFRNCACVHTCFMRFRLDFLFLDPEYRFLRMVSDVGPFRVVHGGRGARTVIEMQAGWFNSDGIEEGSTFELA